MSKVRNLDDARNKCEWCGEPAHPKPLMCPRVTRVKYTDDEITIWFVESPLVINEFNVPKLEP